MRCRVYTPEEAPPVYGRGSRVRFKTKAIVGLKVLNQTVRHEVARDSLGTIVSVFPTPIIDVDALGSDGTPTLMRVTITRLSRLKDLFELIDLKPGLRVVK